MTPIPPVIKTFMLCSVDFCADGADQRAPVLQIALNQLAKLLRREIDTLEAVGLEELLGLGMVQRLRDVSLDLRQKRGRHLRRSPKTEPHGRVEARHGLGNRRQV